MDRRS